MTMKSKRRALEQRVIDEAAKLVGEKPFLSATLTKAVHDLEDLTFDGPVAVGRNAPDTSRVAAQMMAPAADSVRREVLEEIILKYVNGYLGGMTCDQVERERKRPHTTVSSAINWLRDNGWLVDSGMRRMTKAGRPAIVWQPSHRALQYWKNCWRQP